MKHLSYVLVRARLGGFRLSSWSCRFEDDGARKKNNQIAVVGAGLIVGIERIVYLPVVVAAAVKSTTKEEMDLRPKS